MKRVIAESEPKLFDGDRKEIWRWQAAGRI